MHDGKPPLKSGQAAKKENYNSCADNVGSDVHNRILILCG